MTYHINQIASNEIERMSILREEYLDAALAGHQKTAQKKLDCFKKVKQEAFIKIRNEYKRLNKPFNRNRILQMLSL